MLSGPSSIEQPTESPTSAGHSNDLCDLSIGIAGAFLWKSQVGVRSVLRTRSYFRFARSTVNVISLDAVA